ncbi:hypothetical protein AHT35_22310 [Salmonella enterica subsp. enterica]|nr:hypothetical protein [Salmonella enterica subsp. enterica]EDU9994625.1 hypothetical protein [Salmonella enterica subsp. enterica]
MKKLFIISPCAFTRKGFSGLELHEKISDVEIITAESYEEVVAHIEMKAPPFRASTNNCGHDYTLANISSKTTSQRLESETGDVYKSKTKKGPMCIVWNKGTVTTNFTALDKLT